MNTKQVKGSANDAMGKMRRSAGAATGNGSEEVKGAAQQVKGKMQKAAGNVEQAVKRATR